MDFMYIKKQPQMYNGSKLIRLLDQDNLSKMDLFIRESIQNSYDAKKDDTDSIICKISNRQFDCEKLISQLNKIKITEKDYRNKNSCIIMQDYNTNGLDGDIEDFTENSSSNFEKLIYENGDPQNKENSGGSWGYGKTIYYQLGIGIVIYYSRYINKKGEYKSRLIINLIENEKDINSLLNKSNLKNNIGIAYWGLKEKNGYMLPIDDEMIIKDLLKIFDLELYKDVQTGTTIIIPFINESNLIEDFNLHQKNDNNIMQNISFTSLLRFIVSKWYVLKINNEYYKPYINVYINDKQLHVEDMKKSFQVIQKLFNSYRTNDNNNGVVIKDININQKLHDKKAGTLVYSVFSKNELNMLPPLNERSPYYYYNIENNDEDDSSNYPIIAYCRKPGMIINYETSTDWVKNVNPTNSNEFLISLFVLNSDNILKENNDENNISLDTYIKKGEKSNHNSWSDYNSEKRIVRNIKKNVNKELKSITNEKQQNNEIIETSLGQFYAQFFLPTNKFGNLSSSFIEKKSSNKTILKSNNNIKISYRIKELKENIIVFGFDIKYNNSFDIIKLFLGIDSKPKIVTFDEWNKNTSKEFPINIRSVLNQNDSCIISSDSLNESILINNIKKNQLIEFDIELIIKDNKYCPSFIVGV